MTFKLGKMPARPGAVKLKFTDVANLAQMAPPPANFGHNRLVHRWGMLGNDTAGDCVFAATGHDIMLWHAESGQPVSISDKAAIQNYSAFTGYDPSQTDAQGNNPTDQGTDMANWLSAWRKTGFTDDKGDTHKIAAYLSLDPRNLDELHYAAYYFDGVMLGVQFPQQWMDIFQQGGRVWPALKHPDYVGGHCITTVAYRDRKPLAITWGAGVELTTEAVLQTCDEAYAVLSLEKLRNGKDINGFDQPSLVSYLQGLGGVK